MTEHARIKINLKMGEIEIEGSESFVTKQLEEIPGLIESLNISDGFSPGKAQVRLTQLVLIRVENRKKLMGNKVVKTPPANLACLTIFH